ncbi:hypothetical protein KC929_00140 [Patescibacteria group bacterium]|nr:hypothetical protein [Patescibacteria group bacterium]
MPTLQKKEEPPDTNYDETRIDRRLRLIAISIEENTAKYEQALKGLDLLYCGVLKQQNEKLEKELKGISFFKEHGFERTFDEIEITKDFIKRLKKLFKMSFEEESKYEPPLATGHVHSLRQLHSGYSLFSHTLGLERAYLSGLEILYLK